MEPLCLSRLLPNFYSLPSHWNVPGGPCESLPSPAEVWGVLCLLCKDQSKSRMLTWEMFPAEFILGWTDSSVFHGMIWDPSWQLGRAITSHCKPSALGWDWGTAGEWSHFGSLPRPGELHPTANKQLGTQTLKKIKSSVYLSSFLIGVGRCWLALRQRKLVV